MVECLEHELTSPYPSTGAAEINYGEQIPELYLRAIFDSHSLAAAVLDEIGTILYANRSWREFAVHRGFRADFYGVGHNYLDARRQASDASGDQSETLVSGINRILLGRETDFQGEYLCHNSVPRRLVRIHAARLDLPGGIRVLITHEDVTESRQTAEARLKEAERLQRLLNVTRVLPWEADYPTSRFTYVGEQAVDMLGYPAEEWYQPDFWRAHLHPDDRERAVADCIKHSNADDNYELEYRMTAKDGRTVWLQNLVSVIRENGQPKTIRGFSIDITQSKQNEAALSDLSGRLINAHEEERRRVARELHDDVNQRMVLLTIELEQIGLIKEPTDLHRHLESLQTQVREISADIHRLSYKLHPSKLDHLGLAAAVKSLCHELSGKGKTEVELQQSGFPSNLPSDVTLCIFRITQEALGNSIRHSGAGKVRVMIETTSREVRLSVSDDGCGFEMDSEAMKRGLGFTSMRERLRLVGGELQVHSQPSHGTVIEACVPLAHEVQPVPRLVKRKQWRGSWPSSHSRLERRATSR